MAKNEKINSFVEFGKVMGISEQEQTKRQQMAQMWNENNLNAQRDSERIYVPMSVSKEDRGLFIGFYKLYAKTQQDADAADSYKVLYDLGKDEKIKVFYLAEDKEPYGDTAQEIFVGTKTACVVYTMLLRGTGLDQNRSFNLLSQIGKAYVDNKKVVRSVTKTVMNGSRMESTTTTSAPVGTPVEVDHTFEGDENGRPADYQVEVEQTCQTGDSGCTAVAEEPVAESAPVDERIKAAKNEQLKHAKANAKAVEESKQMTADIMKQLAEVQQALADAKEAKRKAEEDAKVQAEVDEINKATEQADAATQAELAEQRKMQEDAMRMLREIQAELEALKG